METTEKLSRAEQARINGAKSQGPKTPEGKEKCAKVNITHGAYAAEQATLPHEDQQAYFSLWTSIVDQFHPSNLFEYSIVDSIVNHQWAARRLARAARKVTEQQMRRIYENSPMNQTWEEVYIRLESDGCPAVERLERRARAHAREVTRLVKLFNDVRKNSKSDKGSQMPIEIMDHVVEIAQRPGTIHLDKDGEITFTPEFVPRL